MSPFTERFDEISARIEPLPPWAASALFRLGAQALLPRYAAWCQESGLPDYSATFTAVTDWLDAPLSTDTDRHHDGIRLLDEIDKHQPDDVTDSYHHVAAQDCWICLDVALRTRLGMALAAPSEYAWFLLEPLFQDVTEDLYGFTEPGSEGEDEVESAVLDDPRVRQAVSDIDSLIDQLAHSTPHHTPPHPDQPPRTGKHRSHRRPASGAPSTRGPVPERPPTTRQAQTDPLAITWGGVEAGRLRPGAVWVPVEAGGSGDKAAA